MNVNEICQEKLLEQLEILSEISKYASEYPHYDSAIVEITDVMIKLVAYLEQRTVN